MVVPLLSPYLRWLQKGNPVGEVEVYPEIGEDGRSSLEGVYIVGDLTGVPLLKMASEGGARMVSTLLADPEFRASRKGAAARKVGAPVASPLESMEAIAAGASGFDGGGIRDVIIVGGGIAGVACALECERQGIDYLVLESSRLFHTIENFPKGKPILAKPDGHATRSPLAIMDGTRESLLEDLRRQLDDVGRPLAVKAGVRVDRIRRKRLPGEGGEVLALEAGDGEYLARRVVLAIGKSGDARRLGVPGEDAPHVRSRLFDAAEFEGEDILVVGGGDSAVEAAVALAESGNRVVLSYRKASLDRPKEENRERFEAWVERGRIAPLFRTEVREIGTGETVLKSPEGTRTVKADKVFVLIGRDLPLAFFRRSGIRMQGQRDLSWYVFLAALVSFFSMLYFGKAGVARDVFQGTEGFLSQAAAYLMGPFQADIWPTLKWSARGHAWYSSLNFLLGWAGSLVFLVSGAWSLSCLLRRRGKYFGTPWGRLKYGYFIAVGLFFTGVYFHYMLGRNAGWVEGPTYWYSLLYSVTIVLFGLRRVMVRRTRYIRWQILSLAFFQVFFLFLLPFHLFDPLIKANFAPDSYVMKEMFPSGKWSSFGYVLFWPLNMNDFGASGFWTWFPLVQTFGILFVIVWLWGKGAYCGWICSCGGMAETLGDEYRATAPHGAAPKRLEHIGQFVLAWAVGATALGYAVKAGWIGGNPLWVDSVRGAYKLGIDVFFAGVLGLGVYFFLSGRVWCRFGCPLAALMHVYSRFSAYRIFSEKKKCISCNICTKVCHMGIDVMGYANKGIPMNDVQCVRCSACVQGCPTQTLSFGSIGKPDPDNRARREVPDYGKDDWRAGIR
jgi:thioredoxin reductase/polyferredoxin